MNAVKGLSAISASMIACKLRWVEGGKSAWREECLHVSMLSDCDLAERSR